ncbi:hypothetical protein PJF56_11985 [Roseofilum sp. BLCC_M91]|uniref:Secreted protein n=1 Tax=Roseofilum halophilum BLCC-M91 TaxID=3022259 RepID=A0ABT7BKK2_9CYAN|nr:hypothetical protein [Roseofilum halophilum]MDJ1179585.1 hypothetical protein [Roseofilum halophilum BLCC-M91]
MRIYNSIKVNRFLFLSLVIGSIGWVNLQTSATVGSEFSQSTTHAEDHRGSGRCDNGCPSSQSFDSTEIARRGSGRIDSNQST